MSTLDTNEDNSLIQPCCRLNIQIKEKLYTLKIDAKTNKDTKKVVKSFVLNHSLFTEYEEIYYKFEQQRMEHGVALENVLRYVRLCL